MLTRRAFGRALGTAFAFAVVPLVARARPDLDVWLSPFGITWIDEYYTMFVRPISAEDIGMSPQPFPGGLVPPVAKRPNDIVIREGDGVDKDGRSWWARRDGDKVYIGVNSLPGPRAAVVAEFLT